METVQKFKAMSLKSDICTVLEQIRWRQLKVSEFKPAFFPELISSNSILSTYVVISLQLSGFDSQAENISCIGRMKISRFLH